MLCKEKVTTEKKLSVLLWRSGQEAMGLDCIRGNSETILNTQPSKMDREELKLLVHERSGSSSDTNLPRTV